VISHAPGTVAVPMAEIGRYAAFTMSLCGTLQPPGCHLSIMASASVTENLNSSIRTMPDESEWMWIVGDDHTWANDCLMQMLYILDEADHVDILVPLVLKRSPPFQPVVFHRDDSLTDPRIPGSEDMPTYRPYHWDELPASGLFEIEAAGSAGMLIRRYVLETLDEPWFHSTGGVILNEDVDAGFRLFATADIVMGHLGIFNVQLHQHEGHWMPKLGFSTSDEQYRDAFLPDALNFPQKAASNGR
jgi:hypothetical protein